MVGIGVGVLLDVPGIGLVAGRVVVAVGANPAFAAGTLPVCVTIGPSNLCNGSSDHPSGIVTPGGRSALPAGMADIFERAPCLCIWGSGVENGAVCLVADVPACGIWKLPANGSDAPFCINRSLASSTCKSCTN